MYSVLIVDDDADLSALLRDCLEQEHITATLAPDGKQALDRVACEHYHLIVLDIMLPKRNGFEVLTALRQITQAPVLMLTAKDSEADKVSGLRLGADDYMTKPFSINEFLARVASLIRRYTAFSCGGAEPTAQVLTCGALVLDGACRTATAAGRLVELTGKEFDLLLFLAASPGKVFTKKQIYQAVWKDAYAYDDANIMSYMSKLRKKLADCGPCGDYIQTVWGVGYRMCPVTPL